ncbi:hypothetical protein [Methylobacterium oryzisoli]|uniref:hypothetical protein n=1 Tax=Methylobacterium oryzisoli TaxID=3385502 RepID=UPI003891F194
MKNILTASYLLLSMPVAAVAQQSPPDPEKQALAYQIQECIEGKTRALTGFIANEAQLKELREKLVAEKKRADEAEGRLRALETSSGQK